MNSNLLTFHRSRKAYLRIIFLIAFLIGILMLCGYLFYDVYINHAPVSDQFFKKWIVMLVFASILIFICTGFMIKTFPKFLKATSSITLSNDGIKIGDDIISFSEIDEIKTIDIGSVSNEYFYGASIILLNGETKFIMGEQFYKNESIIFKELESINQHHFLKNENISSKINEDQNTVEGTTPLFSLEETDSEGKTYNTQSQNSEIQKDKYFGFNIFNLIIYLSYLSIIIISVLGIFKYISSPGIALYFLVLLIVIYYVAARESFHFIIDSHTLQIKNKLLFGYSKTYVLKDIQGIVIYWKNSGRTNQYRMIVTLNDYTSTSFSSDEFRKKQWIKLGKALRNSGVTVVNYWETLD